MTRIAKAFQIILFVGLCVATAEAVMEDCGGNGGASIGGAVSGGAANRVLFEDADQKMAVDGNLAYSTSTRVLSVDSVTAASTGTFQTISVSSNISGGGSVVATGGANFGALNLFSGVSTFTVSGSSMTFGTATIGGKVNVKTSGKVSTNAETSVYTISSDAAQILSLGFSGSGAAPVPLIRTNGTSPSLRFYVGTTGDPTSGWAMSILTSSNFTGVGVDTPTSRLHLGGAMALPTVSTTSAYTAGAADSTIRGDATGGAFSVTLPTAVGITGRVYTVKKIDASVNAVTVATTSAQTIDGATTKALSLQYSSITVQSDGANWHILSGHAAATVY